MSPLVLTIAFACSIVISLSILILFVVLYKKLARQFFLMNTQMESSQLLADELQARLAEQDTLFNQRVEGIQQQTIENDQVTKQLEHRIKVLQEQIAQQNTFIEQIQQQQPEDKLYSRASKLVALGADVEEVMVECDIPRAEAEMLISVHKSKS